MRIAIVGTGYVGLVSGACLSDFGHEVTCIDSDGVKVAALRRGEIPIFEPGLGEVVGNNLSAGRLSFTSDLAAGIAGAQAVFIAVGTPTMAGEARADLSSVFEAARQIAPALADGAVVVTKSTAPVGTGDEIERILRQGAPGKRFFVASNPEFLREGSAIKDFKLPDRIVIGVEDEAAARIMSEIYRPLYLNQGPVMVTGRRTAELIKYAANAYLAMKVTFINEIGNLCEAVGADVQDVARGIGLDNRIGAKFLNAGPGFGGSCFPKDMLALAQTAREAQSPLRIVETVIDVNEKRKIAMADKIIRACGGSIDGKRIGVLGLTFKPNTDDMRDAPAIEIAQMLQAGGASVQGYDPVAMVVAGRHMPGVKLCEDAYEAASGADAVVICTEWNEFKQLNLARLKQSMRQPVIVDGRNIYDPKMAERAGFHYRGMGRGYNGNGPRPG
jgi:UDPglucose 6-dehydrogenase